MGQPCVALARLAGCALAIFSIPGAPADLSTSSSAPFFTAGSIVQAATQTTGALAPNTVATIYGTNLSYETHFLAAADLNRGALPTTLEGVNVYVHGIRCSLFYVSPGQINFLIPYELIASSAEVYVVRQGVAYPPPEDPPITIQLATTAPGFFQWNGNFAVAEHADGSLIREESPARAGEVVVLFAAGLGRTVPDSSSGRVPSAAAAILYAPQLRILLNGVACPPSSVYYAGVTPGYAGLYQINLRLPDVLRADPEIRIAIGAQTSPASIRLTVR
jgi:uncharacterized protein (TIGR03437 family)